MGYRTYAGRYAADCDVWLEVDLYCTCGTKGAPNDGDPCHILTSIFEVIVVLLAPDIDLLLMFALLLMLILIAFWVNLWFHVPYSIHREAVLV